MIKKIIVLIICLSSSIFAQNSGSPKNNSGITSDYDHTNFTHVTKNLQKISSLNSYALPYYEDFESGNFSNWINDSGTGPKYVTSSTAAEGNYSFYYSKVESDPSHFNGIHQDFEAGSQPDYISFYIRSGSTTKHDAYFILRGSNDDSTLVWFFAENNGKLYCNGRYGLGEGDTSYVYNAFQWYHIEFKNFNWSAKTFDYYVNGSLIKQNIYFRSDINDLTNLYLYNYDQSEAWWDGIEIKRNTVSDINLIFNQIDAASFPTIKSYVTVNDNNGNPISNLTNSNFQVREDGTLEQPITVSQVGNTGSNISVGIVIDRSGSMSGTPLDDAKNAAIEFVNNMGVDDKGAVLSFNDLVTLDQGFTTDKVLLEDAINSLVASGRTACYDALYETASQTSTQSGRKAILLLSDGEDNSSSHSLDESINYTNSLGIPAYTIGLGLTPGSDAEQALQRMANETGGEYYYAPSSSDLDAIYQEISQTLNNQYSITYSTHNTNHDGTTRLVDIDVSYGGASGSNNKTYTAPSSPNGSIKTISPATTTAGNEFWVEIEVGNPDQVSNLFGVSFKLNYNSTYLDYVMAETDSWFGNDLVFYATNDDNSGQVSIGISRKSPATGVYGSGKIARVKFISTTNQSNDVDVNFSFSEIQANDPTGNSITLSPLGSNTTIIYGLTVWPGDTNNDGIVNQADVLPIGIYWAKTGYSRNSASIQWVGQNSQPWNPSMATYADATGDGVVNQAEINAIGLNWGKQHNINFAKNILVNNNSKKNLGKLEIQSESNNNYLIKLINNKELKNILGMSFEVNFGNGISNLTINKDKYFDGNVVEFQRKSENSVFYAIVFKNNLENKIISNVPLLRVNCDFEETAQTEFIEIKNVQVVDNRKKIINLDGLRKKIDNMGTFDEQFNDYDLLQNYPNPFNPTTNITYKINEPTNVKLDVYNSVGEKVANLISKYQNEGKYTIEFNASNLSSGIYYYRLETNKNTIVKKLILMK